MTHGLGPGKPGPRAAKPITPPYVENNYPIEVKITFMSITYLVLLCEFFWEFSIFHFCRPLVDIYWHPLLSTELLLLLFCFVPMIKGWNCPIHFVPCFHSLFSENYNLRGRWVHSFSFPLFFRSFFLSSIWFRVLLDRIMFLIPDSTFSIKLENKKRKQ